LIGYANAQDALFLRLKQVVSSSHYTPGELLDRAQTVIVYFLPFDERVARSNRRDVYAAQEWAMAYIETNQLIVAINQHLAQALGQRGYECVVMPPTHNFHEKELLSDWSHKHIGYIAGLGKFGLHQMLITAMGSCGRLGSIVTDAYIEATPRGTEEACLYKYNRTCTACVKRCVSTALTESGFDRHKCYTVLLENAENYKGNGLADVCGKCVSLVPCSFKNPVARLLKTQARRASRHAGTSTESRQADCLEFKTSARGPNRLGSTLDDVAALRHRNP
jgi:epoxyqueuosine reductase QueG